MPGAYYNEHDPKAAAWLRELIKQNHIAPGVVDERSIEDVLPSELREYTQCHFFAGIGVWSYALRKSGWPDERPIWTGSCPCQPFSAAGKGNGFADERHLWPAFFHLIEALSPECVIGEQVASKDGLAWFDLVQSDLEAKGYTVGALDTCAAGFGAPHIRQRLYWLAHNAKQRWQQRRSIETSDGRDAPRLELERLRAVSELVEPQCERTRRELANSLSEEATAQTGGQEDARIDEAWHTSATRGFWQGAGWVDCLDGKWRPVEPGTFPLAHGAPARVGRLRGYGNALCAPQAEGFIAALLDAESDLQIDDISDLI